MLIEHPEFPHTFFIEANKRILVFNHFGEDEARTSNQNTHNPNNHSDHDTGEACGGHDVRQRIHDSDVAVDSHQDQEDAAAAETSVEDPVH